MKATVNGKPTDIPLSLILGLVGVVVGLGSQLWGLAIAGGVFLGYWLLKRYPPRKV
jgi:type IV secretory pathway TrbD component